MDELFWYYPAVCPPQQFLVKEFSWRLRWCVDNHLPHFVEWMQTWCAAIDDGRVRAHITTYEQFICDRRPFFESILGYAGIPISEFIDPQTLPTEDHLFRTGRIDEWRTAMDHATLNQVTNAIPRVLLDRFGWAA
jgi:hypothetical protein